MSTPPPHYPAMGVQRPPFHASARLISPVLLIPPLPDIDDDDDSTGSRLQTQMFDAAQNFPPPRKQNIACDACRTRKVRCHQLPGQDKCTHCQTKNYPCTHFVQQATSDRKRATTGSGSRQKTSRSSSTSSPLEQSSSSSSTAAPSPTSALALSLSPPPMGSPGSGANSTMALLLWLFSPSSSPPLPAHVGGASFQATRAMIQAAGKGAADLFRSSSLSQSSSSDSDWGEIGRKLGDEAFLAEFALDLIEVYMQICHTRQPLLDPDEFRNRFKLSLPTHLQPADTQRHLNFEPLPPALLSIVLAWGAKFSEHPLLISDREANDGRSRISRSLTKKALDIAEGERVYRFATSENILTCMIIEGIQSHSKTDPDRFNKFWVDNAIRLMQDLGINRQPEDQGTMVFCWWIACLSDAIGSAYLRRKPMLDDDDYDTKGLAGTSRFGTVGDPILPPGVQAAYLSWYTSLHALARIIRQMCRWLWIPAAEADGIPYEQLVQLTTLYSGWRDEHLDRVGVPSNFEADWDFVAAVTACSSDAIFHLMWIIMAQALEEYGIKEENDMTRLGLNDQGDSLTMANFEEIKVQITEEAHHGAVRIAGLAGVLTQNGYLRLDPNALHYGIYAAGHVLAQAAHPEVQNCIEGLKQYGMAYEDALDQAAELEQIYHVAVANQGHPSPSAAAALQQQEPFPAQMAMAFTSPPQQPFDPSNFQFPPPFTNIYQQQP